MYIVFNHAMCPFQRQFASTIFFFLSHKIKLFGYSAFIKTVHLVHIAHRLDDNRWK